jgi:hypothetical protein
VAEGEGAYRGRRCCQHRGSRPRGGFRVECHHFLLECLHFLRRLCRLACRPVPGFGVQGLGFWVQGLGLVFGPRVQGAEVGVRCVEFGVWGLGFGAGG